MCKDFLAEIRRKSKKLNDMPDRAQDVLKYFHVNDLSSGVPIVEILTNLGFRIYQSNLEPDGLSAYIAVDPKFKDIFGSNKITCVNLKDSIEHKKFALAHELGHYLFDFNEEEGLYYYDTYFPQINDDKPEERRANRFAANLLMPEKEFCRELDKCKNLQSKQEIIDALGKYFFVSSTAVLKRFRELGIHGYDGDFEK